LGNWFLDEIVYQRERGGYTVAAYTPGHESIYRHKVIDRINLILLEHDQSVPQNL